MTSLGPVTDTDPDLDPAPTPAAAGRDRIVGGVAGLLGSRLGVDALWVRLLFVLLALASGVGLVLYAGLWLALVAGHSSPALRVAGAVVTVGVVPLFLLAAGVDFVDGPVAIVLLLVGLTAALWMPRTPAAPIVAPSGNWTSSDVASPWGPPDEAGGGPRRSVAPRIPRERSLLGRLTLGVALVVGASWALADQLDGGRLHPEQWFGAAAAVCGAGLLVGTFRGRARWLVLPALLLAGTGYVTGQFARLGIGADDAFGDRYVNIGSYTDDTSIAEQVGVGEVQVSVDGLPAQQVHVDARVAIGTIRLVMPTTVTVEVRARADHGNVETDAGQRLDDISTTTFGPSGPPTVIIDAWVGRGDIRITQWSDGVIMAPGMAPTTLPPESAETSAPPATTALVPSQAGDLLAIRDGVSMTADGWVVLGDGSAVISPDDVVTTTAGGGVVEFDDGTREIETSWGPFRLLPRSLLLTPDQQVIDLQSLRQQVAAGSPTTTLPGG